jgi:hypothetical protein
MKRSRFSDEQISYALRQAENGTAVSDVCRELGISDACGPQLIGPLTPPCDRVIADHRGFA